MSAETLGIVLSAIVIVLSLGTGVFAGSAWIVRRIGMAEQRLGARIDTVNDRLGAHIDATDDKLGTLNNKLDARISALDDKLSSARA